MLRKGRCEKIIGGNTGNNRETEEQDGERLKGEERKRGGEGGGGRNGWDPVAGSSHSALKMTLTLFLLHCPQHAPQFAFHRLLLLSLSVSFSLPVYLLPCLVLPPSLSHQTRP